MWYRAGMISSYPHGFRVSDSAIEVDTDVRATLEMPIVHQGSHLQHGFRQPCHDHHLSSTGDTTHVDKRHQTRLVARVQVSKQQPVANLLVLCRTCGYFLQSWFHWYRESFEPTNHIMINESGFLFSIYAKLFGSWNRFLFFAKRKLEKVENGFRNRRVISPSIYFKMYCIKWPSILSSVFLSFL